MHLIIRHKSPLTGEIEEKHLKFPPSVLTDSDTHVYTAILHTNNTCAWTPLSPLLTMARQSQLLGESRLDSLGCHDSDRSQARNQATVLM